MRIGPVIRNLWRLADKAEDRKIDLEADFDGATPEQLDAIDRAQTLTAQAMNLIQDAHGILAEAFPNELPKPKGIQR
jgi:hypothetical protein